MVISQHGLLTTIGYRMGPNAPIYYALEGSVAVGGVSIRWLRDNLQILSDASDSEKVAKKASKTGEVYFVPAFSGLYAPYWRKDARRYIFETYLTVYCKRNLRVINLPAAWRNF